MVTDEAREFYRLQLMLGLSEPDPEFERRLAAHDQERERRLRFSTAGEFEARE